jgi:hypothetical protein
VVQPPSDEKRCLCGRAYDVETWTQLAKVGEIDNGREVGERMELRNCKCGSTLAWELGKHALSFPPKPSTSSAYAR